MRRKSKRSSRLAYSIARLCSETDVGRTILYDEIANGRLIASKLGRRTIVTRKNALAWLNSLPTISAQPIDDPIGTP